MFFEIENTTVYRQVACRTVVVNLPENLASPSGSFQCKIDSKGTLITGYYATTGGQALQATCRLKADDLRWTHTVEPRFNEVLGITNDIFQPSNSVMYGKEPRYNEPSI